MRVLTALALTASLMTAGLTTTGCTNPDGSPDAGATAGLALGLAALGGIAYLATQGDDEPRHHGRGGYNRSSYRDRDYRGYDGYRRR